MTPWIRTVALAALCSLLLSLVFPTQSYADPLRVVATATDESTVPALEFEVTNISGEPVPIYKPSLPWGARYAVMIVAVPDGKEVLRGSYPVEDTFPSEPVVLKPGESLHGRVALSSHVLDVDKVLSAGRLIVFWHYAPLGPKGVFLGEYGGWASFGRTSKTTAVRPKSN